MSDSRAARPAAAGVPGGPPAVGRRRGRAQGRDRLVERGRRRRLRGGSGRDAGHAVPHRLDHEDVHGDGDHAAARRGKLDLDDRLGQHLDDVGDGSPTIRRMLAHISGLQREVGEMFVDLSTPTEAGLVGRVRARAGPRPPLLEPRLRPARPRRRREERGAVRAVRRRERDQATRARADDVALGRAAGAGVPRRRLRAHGLGGARARSRRRRCHGAALVDRRGSRALGDVPRARGGRRARPEDGRGDVVPAGHVLPRRLGARLGARADALQPGRHDLSAGTAARCRVIWPAST